MNLIEPPAAPRTAIFWGREDLLGTALEITLASAGKWRLIRIINNHELQTLSREVERLHPDVIFMSLEGCEEDMRIPVRALEDHPNIRIITISPMNNRVEIFEHRVAWIREMSDLLSIINEESDAVKGVNCSI